MILKVYPAKNLITFLMEKKTTHPLFAIISQS